MNPNRDLSYVGAFGSTIVNGIGTSGGTVDFGPTYEPRFSAVFALGSVHSGGSAIGMVDYSTDGTTWTNLGSLTAPPGSAGSNTVTSADYDFPGRYIRSRIQAVGAGGTVQATMTFAAKPRTVTDA